MASIDANPPELSPRVHLALASLCVLLALEALLFAPLNADAAFTLRQARAQAEGAVPCRDLLCEYTPLATSVLAIAKGALLPSILIVQLAILLCAVLTYRLARTLGHDSPAARGSFLIAWALLLANDGRGIEIEPFAVVCLLCAASTFAASRDPWAAFRAGLWVAAAFWAKQYGLLGWAGLLAACAVERRIKEAVVLTAGVLVGIGSGLLLLLSLGTDASSLATLFGSGAYPGYPVWANLATAPELVGLLVLIGAPLLTSRPAGAARRVTLLLSLTGAAMLPFIFRGYRHYWHFAIPFLAVLMFRVLTPAEAGWPIRIRQAAFALALLSVGLDVGRCARDVATGARARQFAAARYLEALASGAARVLYLTDPALLPLLRGPLLAPREVGPKFTRFSRPEAEALLRAAEMVVWDRALVGSDEPLRRLARDPVDALTRLDFRLVRSHGSIGVYSRPSP